MAEKEKPGPDEMYCSSCGEIIKEEAEICPECGVRNKSGTSNQKHDPSDFDTTVSGKWWYGVAAGTLFWIVFVATSTLMPESWSPGAIWGLALIAGWFITPISAYFDSQYVRANSSWNPDSAIWVILLLIWIVNIPAGIVYLVRRQESMTG